MGNVSVSTCASRLFNLMHLKLTVIVDGQDFCLLAAMFSAVGNDSATHEQTQPCGALSHLRR